MVFFLSDSSEREGKKCNQIFLYTSSIYFPTFGTEFYEAISNLSFWIAIPYLCHTEKKYIYIYFSYSDKMEIT